MKANFQGAKVGLPEASDMKSGKSWLVMCFLMLSLPITAWGALEKDVLPTKGGKLEVTFIGHGSLLFQFGGKTIYIDPFSKAGDYKALPKADMIFITHGHADHLDVEAIAAVRTDKTQIVVPPSGLKAIPDGVVMGNGDKKELAGIPVEAVAAYNLVHKRDDGSPFHPKGEGNGYVFGFGDKKVYVAGDTENTPEMKALKGISVAFLPMNLPYTMTPEMVADAALGFKPAILYPYHTGETDLWKLQTLLKNAKQIEVRLRKMK